MAMITRNPGSVTLKHEMTLQDRPSPRTGSRERLQRARQRLAAEMAALKPWMTGTARHRELISRIALLDRELGRYNH
jgi:hypothetical protein